MHSSKLKEVVVRCRYAKQVAQIESLPGQVLINQLSLVGRICYWSMILFKMFMIISNSTWIQLFCGCNATYLVNKQMRRGSCSDTLSYCLLPANIVSKTTLMLSNTLQAVEVVFVTADAYSSCSIKLASLLRANRFFLHRSLLTLNLIATAALKNMVH